MEVKQVIIKVAIETDTLKMVYLAHWVKETKVTEYRRIKSIMPLFLLKVEETQELSKIEFLNHEKDKAAADKATKSNGSQMNSKF